MILNFTQDCTSKDLYYHFRRGQIYVYFPGFSSINKQNKTSWLNGSGVTDVRLHEHSVTCQEVLKGVSHRKSQLPDSNCVHHPRIPQLTHAQLSVKHLENKLEWVWLLFFDLTFWLDFFYNFCIVPIFKNKYRLINGLYKVHYKFKTFTIYQNICI